MTLTCDIKFAVLECSKSTDWALKGDEEALIKL